MWKQHRLGRIAQRQAVHCGRKTGHSIDVVRAWQPIVCSYTESDFSISNPGVARFGGPERSAKAEPRMPSGSCFSSPYPRCHSEGSQVHHPRQGPAAYVPSGGVNDPSN